jgi:hypothetical protein
VEEFLRHYGLNQYAIIKFNLEEITAKEPYQGAISSSSNRKIVHWHGEPFVIAAIQRALRHRQHFLEPNTPLSARLTRAGH